MTIDKIYTPTELLRDELQDVPHASIFQLFSCGNYNCGVHIVSFDKDHKPICETVVGRVHVPEIIEILQMYLQEGNA